MHPSAVGRSVMSIALRRPVARPMYRKYPMPFLPTDVQIDLRPSRFELRDQTRALP